MRDWVDFSAVKQDVSLEAVLRLYQVKGLYRHRTRLEGCCPIHRGQREDSFRANLSKNVFHCFACQAGGNVLDFVAAMEKCSIRQAALRLQQWFGVPDSVSGWSALPRPAGGDAQKVELVRKKEVCNPPLGFSLTGLDYSHAYLRERGVDRATAMEFGVGLYRGPGLMSGRIVIPVCNAGGQIVGYAGRALQGTPKYKLPAGFRKALEVFNLRRAAATGSKTVIVVEGYFDCIRVHQAKLPWVVALMGSSLSMEQERQLLQRFDQIILMLDGDEAGRAASRAISARLSGKCSLAVVQMPDGTQPDQLPTAAVRRLLDNLRVQP
jgi:DNA primase